MTLLSSFFLYGVHLCQQSIFAKLVDWIANSDRMRLSLSLIENDQLLLIHIFSLNMGCGGACQWPNLLVPRIGGCSGKNPSGVVSSSKATILTWLSFVLSMLLPTNQIPYTSWFYYFWRDAVKWRWRNIPQKHLTASAMWETLTFLPIGRGFPRVQHPSEMPPLSVK